MSLVRPHRHADGRGRADPCRRGDARRRSPPRHGLSGSDHPAPPEIGAPARLHRVVSAGRATGDGELVLGMPDALLELPAVSSRLSRLDLLELGPCRVQLGLGAGVVDLLDIDGIVDECKSRVGLDLEEAWARWRTRRRRCRRDGRGSSPLSALQQGAHAGRGRRSRRRRRGRSAAPLLPGIQGRPA